MENLSQNCLIDELSKLKESSKEAVETLETFSEFKHYMHIKRNVQDQLLDLIKNSIESDRSQLILVCGGVGDGKSHLLSYLIEKNSGIKDTFILYNDATESFDPQKTSIDTLNIILNDFSDDQLNKGEPKKIILLINLGTLNNFIESKYHDRFSQLKKYILDQSILEEKVTIHQFNPDSSFQYINFSDYHMFTLTPDGPKSNYMKQIINKIVQEREDNQFYRSYKTTCNSCNIKDQCPIKFNYEFLQNDETQNNLIQLLIEASIKHKLIISTRDILNFIYDLITCNYDRIQLEKVFNGPVTMEKVNLYISLLIPTTIFEHYDLSPIFKTLSYLDPISIRTEELDQEIIQYNNIEDFTQVFNKNLNIHNIQYLEQYALKRENREILCMTNEKSKKMKQELIKLFIRFYKFIPKGEKFDLLDHYYKQYMSYLYYWNKGEKQELKNLYLDVKDCIYSWDGNNDNETINLFVGRRQLKYLISQELHIGPDLSNLNDYNSTELDQFINVLTLQFKGATSQTICKISIDYSLYNLLMQIKKGYRPNKRDKMNFINFNEFVSQILELGNQNQELYFEDRNSETPKKYRFSFDKDFGQYEFREMST